MNVVSTLLQLIGVLFLGYPLYKIYKLRSVSSSTRGAVNNRYPKDVIYTGITGYALIVAGYFLEILSTTIL